MGSAWAISVGRGSIKLSQQVRWLACAAGKLPFSHAPTDDRELPDMHMALYNTVIVFDQATKLAYVITWVHLDRHASLEEAYQHGQEQLRRTSRKIENEHSPNLTNGKVGLGFHFARPLHPPTIEHAPKIMRACTAVP